MSDRYLRAKRESKTLDFKRTFNPGSAADWCEIIKDLVAMANSGGGHIVVGVNDDGTPAGGECVEAVLGLDSAVITDKVAKYTGAQFDGFGVLDGIRGGIRVAVINVEDGARPMMFEKPGTYSVGDGKQKTAFGAGTLYVRHGAKSEPATSEDLARIIERQLQRVRREWLAGVRRVVNAPTGSVVSVAPANVRQSDAPDAAPIRLTDDPSAAEYRLVDPDKTHPWRQKELIVEINTAVAPQHRINQYHIRAVRHLYSIDTDGRYFHKSKFAAPQYSPDFKTWLLARYAEDPRFFERACEEFKRRQSA